MNDIGGKVMSSAGVCCEAVLVAFVLLFSMGAYANQPDIVSDNGKTANGDAAGRSPLAANDVSVTPPDGSEGETPDSAATLEEANTVEANRLFARGKALFQAKEYRTAMDAFKKAQKLKPHPAVMVNIGLCYEKMGDFAGAYTVYTECLENDSEGLSPPWLKQRIGELKEKVGVLTVECSLEDCRITVDGVVQPLSPAMVVLMPGEHLAVAFDGDREYARVSRYLRAGETSHILLMAAEAPKVQTVAATPLAPQPDSMITATAPERTDARRHRLLPVFWIVSGVTLSAGVATTVLGFKTLDDRDSWQNDPAPDDDVKEQGEQHRLLTNIMLGTTIASATAAAVIGIFHLRNKSKTVSASVSGARSMVRSGTMGYGTGVFVGGHF